ncbi:NAD(+) diphosphatase [Homoserinibacter sp. YIM 151385]|uniref:NAD(+) diphosphatase n=1 Tax=Homoserinibacter sp. YIM 151385 TaxID=2985506 RepID=UPI0022F0CF26|nr:NAD(+) diphosphatase [Homoserinibacter sp. YIM 151385]WBU38154.1 NAD(+) diphosphatase [Homoserinibacter sp. YIM 151385]
MRAPFPERLVLSRHAIDRDHLGRAAGIPALLAEPGAVVLALHDGLALAETAHGPLALLDPAGADGIELVLYLGRLAEPRGSSPAGAPVVAAILDDAAAESLVREPGTEWIDLRRLGHELDPIDAGLFTSALALANWHRVAGFSPRSGIATAVEQSGWVRREESGTEHFPRTDPAIIVGVLDEEDRILLGSNAMWESRRFSLLAGFVEPGESLEAAVVREVHEESGIRVTAPHYLGSQPWPFPASLMLGFTARVAPGTTTEPTPDGEEILDLRWFSREELRAAVAADDVILPGPTSIARAIIEEWYGGDPDAGAPSR